MALTAQLSITALTALTGAAGIKLACKFAPQGTTFDNLYGSATLFFLMRKL